MHFHLRAIPIEIWLALCIAFTAIFINVFLLPHSPDEQWYFFGVTEYLSYGRPALQIFSFGLVSLFFAKIFWRLGSALFVVRDGIRGTLRTEDWQFITHKFSEIFLALIPLAIIGVPKYELLIDLSRALSQFPSTSILLASDRMLTGGIPIVDIPNWLNSTLGAGVLLFFYTTLLILAQCFFLYLFFRYRTTLYRQFLIAFLIGTTLAYIGSTLLPCAVPSISYLQNFEALVYSPELTHLLNTYDPTAYVTQSQNEIIRTQEIVGPHQYLISCFPSLHAFWSLLVVYFLWRIKPTTLFLTLPWIFLVLWGGILVGEHFLIDYVAAIPTALLSIGISLALLQFERSRKLGPYSTTASTQSKS